MLFYLIEKKITDLVLICTSVIRIHIIEFVYYEYYVYGNMSKSIHIYIIQPNIGTFIHIIILCNTNRYKLYCIILTI